MKKEIPKNRRKSKHALDEWNREKTLFQRDCKGELLPSLVPLLGDPDTEICMVPLTRGQMNELKLKITLEDWDHKVLVRYIFDKCLVEPELDPELIKYDYFAKVYKTLLFECGYDVDGSPKKDEGKQSLRRKLYELIKRDDNIASEAAHLHELGYNFFDIPRLTGTEIVLVTKKYHEMLGKRFGGGKKNTPKGRVGK